MSEVIRVSKRDFIQNTSKYLKAGVIITHRGVDQLTVQNVATNIDTMYINVATKAPKTVKNVATKKNKPENVATNKTNVTTFKERLSDKVKNVATLIIDDSKEPTDKPMMDEYVEKCVKPLMTVDRIPKTYNSEHYGCGCAKSEKYLCGKHGRI